MNIQQVKMEPVPTVAIFSWIYFKSFSKGDKEKV